MRRLLKEKQLRQLIRKSIILAEGTPAPPSTFFPNYTPGSGATPPGPASLPGLDIPNLEDYYNRLTPATILSFPNGIGDNKPGVRDSTMTTAQLEIDFVISPEGAGGKKIGVITDESLKDFAEAFNLTAQIDPGKEYNDVYDGGISDSGGGKLNNEDPLYRKNHLGLENFYCALLILSDFKAAKTGTVDRISLYDMYGSTGTKASRLLNAIKSAPFDDIVVAGYGLLDDSLISLDAHIPEFYSPGDVSDLGGWFVASAGEAAYGEGPIRSFLADLGGEIVDGLITLVPFVNNIPVPWMRDRKVAMTKWVGGGEGDSLWKLQGFANPGKVFLNAYTSTDGGGLNDTYKRLITQHFRNAVDKYSGIHKHIKKVLANTDTAINLAEKGKAAISQTEYYKVMAKYYYVMWGGAELIDTLKRAVGDTYKAYTYNVGTLDSSTQNLVDYFKGNSDAFDEDY